MACYFRKSQNNDQMKKTLCRFQNIDQCLPFIKPQKNLFDLTHFQLLNDNRVMFKFLFILILFAFSPTGEGLEEYNFRTLKKIGPVGDNSSIIYPVAIIPNKNIVFYNQWLEEGRGFLQARLFAVNLKTDRKETLWSYTNKNPPKFNSPAQTEHLISSNIKKWTKILKGKNYTGGEFHFYEKQPAKINNDSINIVVSKSKSQNKVFVKSKLYGEKKIGSFSLNCMGKKNESKFCNTLNVLGFYHWQDSNKIAVLLNKGHEMEPEFISYEVMGADLKQGFRKSKK